MGRIGAEVEIFIGAAFFALVRRRASLMYEPQLCAEGKVTAAELVFRTLLWGFG